jgi:hypothetical protein
VLRAVRYLEQNLDHGKKSRFHFFNSFFYKKLTEKVPGQAKLSEEEKEKRNHDRVKKWTKVSGPGQGPWADRPCLTSRAGRSKQGLVSYYHPCWHIALLWLRVWYTNSFLC